MTLRTVTIWTTGVVLLLTILVPIVLFCYASYNLIVSERLDQLGSVVYLFLLWFSSTFPLVASYFIARYLKMGISLAVILGSTIVYALVYVHGLYIMFFVNGMMFFWVMFTGMLLLPAMIPVWFVACTVDWRYRKKNQPTPPEP